MAASAPVKEKTSDHIEELTDPSHASQRHIEGNALLLDKHGTLRKLPLPSNDPRDPLNFTKWEKWAVIFCCCWFSKSTQDVVYLLTVPSLCIGLGNLIILPLALAFGRRPVFLASMVILLAATIGSATQNSYEGHLVSRIFQGLSTGAAESLLPLMLTEITFLHERGAIFGLYWMVQNVFTSGLNIASSYEVAALGWRWYYWVFVITVAVGLVIAFFCAFETRFSRPAASVDGRIIYTDDFGVTRVVPDYQAQDFMDRLNPQPDPQSEPNTPLQRIPYLQRLKPWSEPHPQPIHMLLQTYVNLAQSLTSPAIIYTILLTSITLGAAIDLSLTFDAVLQNLYNWPAKNVGLLQIGSIVGSLLGTAYTTFLGDPFVLYLAKRNRGVHKPEHRLLVLIPAGILGTAMLVLYGFKAQHAGPNAWGLIVSYTFFQAAFIVVLIVSTTFASEASPKHPGPALVMVVGSKNVVSFGATYGFTPLVARTGGYLGAFGVVAGILGGIFLLGLPVYVLEPRWRSFVARRDERRGVDVTD